MAIIEYAAMFLRAWMLCCIWQGLIERSKKNYEVIEKFVEQNSWISFLAKDPKIRSTTSVCLQLDLNKDQVRHYTSSADI